MTPALEVQRLTKRYGGLVVLDLVDLRVAPGERRAVIGPNGAGKSTLFHLITGMVQPDEGRVLLNGRDVSRVAVEDRVRLGLARTFQRNNLCLNLTALENVRMAVQIRHGAGADFWRPVARHTAMRDEAMAVLEQVGLADSAGRRAGELSYGEQRQLEVALALACRPQVLLLDEPTAGMSPAETERMVGLLQALPRETTLLVIEHDMDVVGALATHMTVLHYGGVIADGPADQVRADPRVQAVYLGEEVQPHAPG